MSEAKKKHRYKHAEGKRWIEVRVKSPQQLFDARDPAPFRDRDLDDDFVEYIVSSAKEFSGSVPLKIVIYVEDAATADLSKDSIREAIHSYFAYRIESLRRDLKTFLKRAQVFLFIGLLILAVCLGLAQSLTVPTPPGAVGILREGLVIFGWVSIWKPIELVLFDWYPLFETIRLHRKLLATEIEIRFQTS
ncbi:MAG: hypothetical protein NDI61_08060 [Bdellovibrionaceae bacterium]|nr:hypothetical protein [Pseudobdellovibrionaceae bacterium]